MEQLLHCMNYKVASVVSYFATYDTTRLIIDLLLFLVSFTLGHFKVIDRLSDSCYMRLNVVQTSA